MKQYSVQAAAAALLAAVGAATAAESFRDLVGPAPVNAVQAGTTVQVPFITWGGDMATFYANGGLATKPGTIFQKQGLNVRLVPGDDFPRQVRDYLGGKSPFLRGTFRMLGMASEVIGSDPRTKGVVVFQMTWSAGDHAVARPRVKTLKDLKGATVCLQKGGPHEGLLDDLLRDAGLAWSDVKVVWVKDLTGPGGAAEAFRKNAAIDACFVISPDMIGLTGGLQGTGSGAEGTVRDARVLASTAERSRSIADVYACRKDWYDANRAWVEKFAAGYLKACEEVVELKKQYTARGSQSYLALLKLTQDIYGKEVIPTLEEDAHGLLCDCTFAGYAGNVSFFTDPANLHGFEVFQKSALDLAMTRGYAQVRQGLLPSSLDWKAPAFTAYLTRTAEGVQDRFRPEAVASEIEALNAGQLDERTIYDFSIEFRPNQNDFSVVEYGAQFQKVVELADKYGNAVIAVRGHADPTKTLYEVVQAGMKKGILTRRGTSGNFQYLLKGAPLDLQATARIVDMITAGEFDGAPDANPRETMQAALNLSRVRAEEVKKAVIDYAARKGARIDATQIQPVGVGVREPIVPKPANMAEAQRNMRVEFRILRVSAEAVKPSDFDF